MCSMMSGEDFNEVLHSGDRSRSEVSRSHMANFHSWVSDFALNGLPLQNIQYT